VLSRKKTPTKVYLASSGEQGGYEAEYAVHAVFSTREAAEAYLDLMGFQSRYIDAYVEAFDLDPDTTHLKKTWSVRVGGSDDVTVVRYQPEDESARWSRTLFYDKYKPAGADVVLVAMVHADTEAEAKEKAMARAGRIWESGKWGTPEGLEVE
jgi:hypothetical protein